MDKVQIFFIYAEECQACEEAKEAIGSAIQESDIPCEVKMFNCEERVAVNIAINNDVSDLPACVIGGGVAVFQGKNFPKQEIIKAIKKAAS